MRRVPSREDVTRKRLRERHPEREEKEKRKLLEKGCKQGETISKRKI